MDKRFTGKLQKSAAKGGWTYVVMPGSVAYFGTVAHRVYLGIRHETHDEPDGDDVIDDTRRWMEGFARRG